MAPEIRGITICGDYGGQCIRTSLVESVDGKIVKTRSGSTYQLGTVKPQFLDYLKECGYKFDPENPIRTVDKLTELEPKKN